MANPLNPKQFSRPTTYHKKLSTTAMTVMYTVPANFSSHLQCMHVCNEGTSNVHFTMELVDAAPSQTISLYHSVIIAGKAYLTVDNLHLYLSPGDVIQVQAETANKLSVSLSFDEQYDPNTTHST
jgi:quercetin dioxygenase-like cupin family protein